MQDLAKKITLEETDTFDAGGFSGQVYIPKELKAGFNALLITVTGHHPKKRMIDTTRNYFVVEGKGTFTLDGEVHRIQKGDLFVISAGHEYEYEGTMTLFEFNISPDNSFKDERLG